MKIKHNSLVEYVILGVLGSLVVLTLAVPPLLRDRRCAPVLSLSVPLTACGCRHWLEKERGVGWLSG